MICYDLIIINFKSKAKNVDQVMACEENVNVRVEKHVESAKIVVKDDNKNEITVIKKDITSTEQTQDITNNSPKLNGSIPPLEEKPTEVEQQS